MKKLTNQEIEVLHQFVQKHYVEYYDVEVELVDHLANGIEKQWEEDNQLPFEQALNIEFKKFGIFGFSEIVEKKEKQLSWYYYKELFKAIGNYFSSPKIICIVALLSMLFLIGIKFPNDSSQIYIAILIVISILHLGYGIHWYYSIKKKAKVIPKKFLLFKIALQGFSIPFIGCIYPLVNLLFVILERQLRLNQIIIYSVVILFFGLWTFVNIVVFKPLITKHLNQTLLSYKFT
ncbi:hypothetical protein [Myroides injenensis]|uniref:hypothetical protein n=1 Tax=Myroides injenensis TaxID=1183151 RepID=UPI00028869DC|nr:hypothetical protein [Myroides injenensis]